MKSETDGEGGGSSSRGWACVALALTLTLTLALTLAACSDGNGGSGSGGSAGTTAGGGGSGGTGAETSTSAGGSGGGTATGGSPTTSTGGSGGDQPYPPPPYGYDIGSTIENYGFYGYPQPQDNLGTAALVRLGDFYNPTGQGLFPAGAPYGEGTVMPELLFIHAAAVWSGPDIYQAEQITPGALTSYGPCLQAIDVLIDGPTPGMTATMTTANDWAEQYACTYPVVIDPAFQLSPVFADEAYPTNILIDTQTMKIAEVFTGVPELGSSFFAVNVDPVCP